MVLGPDFILNVGRWLDSHAPPRTSQAQQPWALPEPGRLSLCYGRNRRDGRRQYGCRCSLTRSLGCFAVTGKTREQGDDTFAIVYSIHQTKNKVWRCGVSVHFEGRQSGCSSGGRGAEYRPGT